MDDFLLETVTGETKPYVESLRKLLGQFRAPFISGDAGIFKVWITKSLEKNKLYLPKKERISIW